MLSDSCFFSPWWSLWLSRILLSSFHGMISSFHGMIPSYHDMISSYHAVFGLRHRDKSAKVIGLSGQTRGERDSTTGVFSPQTFTIADANVYNGGCKRLRCRMQTFTMADANVYGKKNIHLENQILSGQYLFPEVSYSSKERPWEKTSPLPYLVWKSIMRAMAR